MAKADEAHDMENPSLKAWGYSRTFSIIHSHPQPEGIEL
jgi:hypothetical protein